MTTGCALAGTPLVVPPGGVDVDTRTIALVTISQTTTTTNTFLTTALYELDGFPQGVPVTPAPPALLLMLTALAGIAVFAATRKFARRA